ncbi:hypothetical protein FRC02_008759 [Tulasnella sp. 418]|nr:hypothetical protein FRC02_008759 [Tulasnella sp. 418]
MSEVTVPPHKLYSNPDDSVRSIDIENWSITATSLPISTSKEIDDAHEQLNGLPIPEMPFGNNYLILKHNPTGWEYRFDTLNALKGVKLGELGEGDGGVKVGYAQEWMKSRTSPTSETPMPETSPTKPYDWTYTTTYGGHTTENTPSDIRWVPADPENRSHVIPLDKLARKDPILYYAEVRLFEDELHDNGSSQYIVRIRVMPTSFFILARFTLRVDNVLFRTYDTRIYHSFIPEPDLEEPVPFIVKEMSGWEAPYDVIKRHLPKRDDLTPLTDPGFIAQTLTSLPKSVAQNRRTPGGSGWRGLGTKVECCFLKTQNIATTTEPQ